MRGRVLVLYGSQTGCAEEVAQRVAAEALRQRYEPACHSMEEFDVRQLPSERFIVLVASTTGEGEVPDAMRALWRFLLRKDLPAGSLHGVRHACFGLGDSSYPKFNFAAKRLHRRFEQLGSAALLPIGLGDDQDDLGLDQAFEPWHEALWNAAHLLYPLPAGVEVVPVSELPPPRYAVQLLDGGGGPPAADVAHTAPYGRQRPAVASVVSNELLTAVGCGREVRHIVLDTSGCDGGGLGHLPGDALAVQPHNPTQPTLELLATLGLDPAARVRLDAAQPHAPPLRRREMSVADLFVRQLDVFGIPRRSFFTLLARFATDEMQAERLAEFGTAAGGADLLDYVTRPRRTYAEVLCDFSSARPPLEYYLDLIPPLRERYFSIASAAALAPARVHIAVAVVRYRTMLQAPRFGVGSTYLAELEPAAQVEVWLRRGCLRLPDDPAAPLVMVGPGTGVAPFRAFVQVRQAQREASGAAAANGGAAAALGEAHLFFGCRRREHDFLYADEWQEHLRAGNLQQLHTAFSREGPRKVYVQHRMVEPEAGAQLWNLIATQDAHVYIAGAANQMPKDVRKALRQLAATHGGLDEDATTELVKRLEARGRLQCETW